ncbi:hypothetical protein Ahy_A09g046365 [Arachis hypogaea]|uniref:Uncharacterized protein n=1 Tax=Arachis hypogaea TaxID=3818 RepID=A0A445BPJ6_ARAHY|nr:hypothetical protein Ahy_A09g046365 [Arachis hypogaea]
MWEKFLEPFRFENNRGKIFLTTRSENVVSVFAANNLHYRLSLLLEDCWLVFLKHSSISTDSKQYTTLEPVDRKFVKKCKGLPLAVKTLGGLLHNKYHEGDWELECKIWEFSYDDCKIVSRLKQCSLLGNFENLHGVNSKIRHLSFSSESRDIITSFGEARKRAAHLRTALDFSSYGYRQSINVKSIPWLLQQQLRVLSFPIKSLTEIAALNHSSSLSPQTK